MQRKPDLGFQYDSSKHGLSAYMFFANETREIGERETLASRLVSAASLILPPSKSLTASIGNVGKILGEKCKSLNEKQKAPFEAKAAADKKHYEEE